jgi:hypothetical protein
MSHPDGLLHGITDATSATKCEATDRNYSSSNNNNSLTTTKHIYMIKCYIRSFIGSQLGKQKKLKLENDAQH